MYHQNLGSRRFNNLTYELLYQTPRQFSGSFPAASPYKPQTRPSFGNRAASTSSTNSSSSSPARNNNKGSFRRKSQKTSKIAAAAAFAEEKEQRGRRKQRVSTATTVNGDGVVHEVGVDDLKHAAMAEEEGGEGFRDRKSSATLSIVLNQYEQEMNSRTGTAEGDVGEYVENVESRIPNVPYKSVTHPDVALPRTTDPVEAGNDGAMVKSKWRKQPLEKISQKTHNLKLKFDEQKTSIREKIPFLRNGSTMDRIKETFKFSRFTKKH